MEHSPIKPNNSLEDEHQQEQARTSMRRNYSHDHSDDTSGSYYYASPTSKHRYWGNHRQDSTDDGSCSLQSGKYQSNPQSWAADEPGEVRKTLVFTAKKKKSSFPLAVVTFSIFGFYLYTSAQSTLQIALSEADRLVKLSDRLSNQVTRAARDVRSLERELAALDAIEQKRQDMEQEQRILDQASLFADPKVVEEVSAIQQKLRQSASTAEKLKAQMKETSKQDALQKYGPGPHRVQMELIFPGHLAGPTTFVIEMAPLNVMPHSVYTFLEMTSLGLLDGCSFILNALHVVKAAPLPFDGTLNQDKAREFVDKGLESVAFREYSTEYPHKPYTVGFAADGTPSFYINTEDNTEIHVGDPCFGKVVSGFEAVNRLENMPTRNGIWFENRIGIRRAVILPEATK